MPGAVLLTHPSSSVHDAGPGHPERPQRMAAVVGALDGVGWLGAARLEAPPASDAQLLAVHPAAYLDGLRGFTGHLDADTAMGPGSWEAALHGSGGAARAVDLVLGGDAAFAGSLARPPGHHAEAARAMGFCLLNHVAVAARHALDAHGLRRVLVLDWDVHHGNGTNDLFHADERVLFASVHESPLYPGTGPASDAGSGRGIGHTVNLPVPGGSGDAVWCSMLEHVVAPLTLAYEPELVLVSAGFDAHADDPLATCRVSDGGFAAMAASVARAAGRLGVPVALVLEGGYALDALGRSLVTALRVLAAGEREAPLAALDSIEPHPLALRARHRLAQHWPALG